jgi:hypothetical protein
MSLTAICGLLVLLPIALVINGWIQADRQPPSPRRPSAPPPPPAPPTPRQRITGNGTALALVIGAIVLLTLAQVLLIPHH